MKNKLFIILIVCASLTLSGCNMEKNSYSWKGYEKDDLLLIYQQNEKLFNDVVDVIINEPQFWEKCGSPYESFSHPNICSPNEKEKMAVFNKKDKEIILDFFELRPYMIGYDYFKYYVKITFINAEKDDAYVFMYWPDPCATIYNGIQNLNALEERLIMIKQNDMVVETLSENWYFYYKDSSPSIQSN